VADLPVQALLEPGHLDRWPFRGRRSVRVHPIASLMPNTSQPTASQSG
jgi:hypothetical protein